MNVIDRVREFNRFYTREIGLLAKHLPASSFSLAEARVLYELAQKTQAAADLGRTLRMDRAHLSRMVARFKKAGLVRSSVSPEHAKRMLLSLTKRGRDAFSQLNEGTCVQIEALLASVPEEERERLVCAMRSIESVLGGEKPDKARVRLRALVPGDLGWITHRQAVLYNREYGWDWTYEGLVFDILGKFVAGFDPVREDAWVAETDYGIAGSIFLMKSDDPAVAKLRLLYVEPRMRGLGIGRKLVQTCIERARQLGYRELTLWTNDVLVSARRIYEAAGFRLVDQSAHHSFGHDLVGQTWTLDLASSGTN